MTDLKFMACKENLPSCCGAIPALVVCTVYGYLSVCLLLEELDSHLGQWKS